MNLSNIPPEELEKFINNGGLESLQLPNPSPAVPDCNVASSEVLCQASNLQSFIQDSVHRGEQTFIQTAPDNGETTHLEFTNNSPSQEKAPSTPLNDLQENSALPKEGNSVDSQNTGDASSLVPTRTEAFDFKDPVELLYCLDDTISTGKISLHDWQIQFMLDFAAGGKDAEHPFHSLVRAANGSGKDKYVIAACSVWLAMAFFRSNSVVTSSSGQQLDTQTCRHISYLCQQANTKLCPDIWKINYRHYTCLATASVIDCFATDEAGKAEGFHPLDYGCKMALFMSEAKTVTDEINSAYDRCDGYTHRIHVSSPGNATGHFHDDCRHSIPRNTIKNVTDIDPALWIHYHITAFDCDHISKVRIRMLITKYGEEDPLVQSSIYAEFTSLGEKVVIPFNFVNQCKEGNDITWEKEAHNSAGLDLADGGDETVLIVRNGNKIINICPFRLDNSDDTYFRVDELLRENNLNNPESKIFADCGGIGKPTLDRLTRNGWLNIRYIDNRHAAYDKLAFHKRNTEMWWDVRKLMQRKGIIVPNDKKLIDQLCGRYYKFVDGVKRQLLSKPEQKAKGYKSPDRADGMVLAFCGYKSKYKEILPEDKHPFKIEAEKPTSDFTVNDALKHKRESLTAWNTNPSKGKDFSLLKEQIADYNNQRKLQYATEE